MEKSPIATVIGGLRVAAHALARKLGVTVSIGGPQACTDGRTIRLPDLPADSEEAALLARGYLDHETAHIRFTDFNIPVRPWLNLLEDIRIEREQGKEFPGCAVNLRQLTAHLKEKGHFRGSGRHPLSCLMAWACCHGRSTVLRQPLAEIAAEMQTLSRTLFGEDFCDAFQQLIDEIGRGHSTADCDALARRIEALIANPPPPPPQAAPPGHAPTEQGQGPKGQDQVQGPPRAEKRPTPGQQQEPHGAPTPAPEPSGQAGSTPAAAATASSGTDHTGTGSGHPGTGTDGGPEETAGAGRTQAGTAPPAGSDASERQRQNLARAAGADAERAARGLDVGGILRQALAGQHQQAQQQGRLETIPETHRQRGGSSDLDQRQLEQALGIDQARRQTAQLRARLAGLLQSRRRQPSYPRRSGQRLDREGLHHLAAPTPDARLFRCRTEKIDSDTAVLILGDRSGSMSGPRMQTAIRSAYVTAATLELLPGVACAVGFFPWAEKVALVKDFGEKLQPGRFALQASGSTPMAEALLWAAMQLTHRKERRKLVIALTDGQPDDVEATGTVMKRLQACGIETFGIGIQDKSILSWMNKGARVIHECGELPQALVDLLREALLGKTAVGR